MNKVIAVFFCFFVVTFCFVVAPDAQNNQPNGISKESSLCIDCHQAYNPGIVGDWRKSRHARTSPKSAMEKLAINSRITSENIPASLQGSVVGCYECHALNGDNHKDNFDHFDFKINSVVSPNDCKTCHTTEADQYSKSKKAHALSNLRDNPVFSLLVNTVTGTKAVKGGKVTHRNPSEQTKNETCYACHGTEVKVLGMKKISTDLGDIEVPDLTNIPNQGVGRMNPDGSSGACTACHPRHTFSIEVARKPFTCAQCHLEPDTPAWDVYQESKHGNIFFSRERRWNFENVPWIVGRDFTAPTCAACHSSLITSEDGKVIRKRTHDFGERLWVRIFGLPYAHPQPKDGRTYIIRNKDKMPLPVTFAGEPASQFLIDKKEQDGRQKAMEGLCRACHSIQWTEKHFVKFDNTNRETDGMILASTQLLDEAWKKGLANKVNPFDEKIEQTWLNQWLFYGNSIRYGSAMGGHDYTTFKNGWWNLTKTLEEMRVYIDSGKKVRTDVPKKDR